MSSMRSPKLALNNPTSYPPVVLVRPHAVNTECFTQEAEPVRPNAVYMDCVTHMAATLRANAVSMDSATESAGALYSQPHTSVLELWNADTGATSHMTPRRDWFKDYKPSQVLIRVANDQLVRAAGVGTVEFIPVKDGVQLRPLLFTGVLHVPDLAQNLFSVLTLTRKHNFRVLIDANTVSFLRDGQTHFHASINDNMVAYLSGSTVTQSVSKSHNAVPKGEHAGPEAFAAGPKVDYDTWHKRLCHPGRDRTLRLVKENLVLGLDLVGVPSHPDLCTTCIAGKQTRLPFPSSESRSSAPLQLINSDLHGPLPPTASGFRYWVLFEDDYSRYRSVYLLRKKSETFAAFKEFKALVENQLDLHIKQFRDDKGGEYMLNQWEQFAKEHGIGRQHTVRATPQQNGVAERSNRILDEGITSLLTDAKLPSSFWGEALSTFLHVLNRTPTSALSSMTPFEAFFGKKPSVAHLNVCGSRAHVHIQRDKRRPFEPKSEKCIFIGYPLDYKGWKCYNPVTKRAIISRDVIFEESLLPGIGLTTHSTMYQPLGIPALGPGEVHDTFGPSAPNGDSESSDEDEPISPESASIPPVSRTPSVDPLNIIPTPETQS